MREVTVKEPGSARVTDAEQWEEVYAGLCRKYVPSDALCELGVLATAWMTGSVELIGRLHENDFYNPQHKFMFNEFKLLIESGEPFGDGAAVSRWFGTDAVKQRAWRQLEEARPKELLWVMLQKYAESFLGTAHLDYYREVVRADRLRRAIFKVALTLIEANQANTKEPWKTVERIHSMASQLSEICYEVFPERMESA
jgi:replicative DNA helicase